eukprot:Phypoly_transcript_01937.p1 GENE.Phypoly_transcript_01937~~Phypoly_transcript_01937.p1  ORF type:complete len:974 (+),score=196.04 Phypoly_transcript_01937:50-2971(+)
MANANLALHACLMDPSEGGDLEKVFNICDGDGDGFLTKEELEHILQDIGVEHEDIEEFMQGLGSEEFINFAMFTEAIDKFRSNPLGHSSIYLQSVNSNRGSPRSLAGSAAGGDHVDCNFAIHELSSRNSVLSKQTFALEAQVAELRLELEDKIKHDKTQEKELRRLQSRFAEISAELEAAKQANKDMLNREDELKRRMRQLREQQGDIEGDLLTARAELESARNSGSNQSAIVKAPKVHPDTQAEFDRLHEELERTKEERTQLRTANEDLSRVHADSESCIEILKAGIERLKLELEAKDVLFAELGLVPDKLGGVTDLQGKTWHGFRNVSPLYSELGQVHDQPLHPSLLDARGLPYAGKQDFDSAFLKEKVANVNEEIRSRGVHNRKPQISNFGSVATNSDEPGGESDTSYSVSENEDLLHTRSDRHMDDQSDLVTSQLMNLSDLAITTSDIAHSNRATPTNLRGESSTPSTGGRSSTSGAPVSESSDVPSENDESVSHARAQAQAQAQARARAAPDAVVDVSAALSSAGALASPVIRATTPTPTHGYGPSPDEAHHNLMHVHDSPPGTAQNSALPTPKLDDVPKLSLGTPRQPNLQPTTPHARPSSISPRTPGSVQPSPRTPNGAPQSAPSTFRLDSDPNPSAQDFATPVALGKRITVSKSEKIIRQKSDRVPKAEPSPYKPSASKQKPELQRHKSESEFRNISPGLKNMDSEQVIELQEFALKTGLIRSRTGLPKVDKYVQADPSEFAEGAQVDGKIVTPSASTNTDAQRMHRARSQPHLAQQKPQPTLLTPQRTAQRTPQQTPSARTAQQSDRRIIVRGNPYLIRLLSYPDPTIDGMEEIVKKLEAELDGIEERLNKPSLPISSSSISSTATPSTPTPPTPTPSSATSSSSTSSSATSSSATLTPATHPSFTRRTFRPSPLVTAGSQPRSATTRRARTWWWAMMGAVGCLVLMIVVGVTKLLFSRFRTKM